MIGFPLERKKFCPTEQQKGGSADKYTYVEGAPEWPDKRPGHWLHIYSDRSQKDTETRLCVPGARVVCVSVCPSKSFFLCRPFVAQKCSKRRKAARSINRGQEGCVA